MCTANELSFEQIKNALDKQVKKDYLIRPKDIVPVMDGNTDRICLHLGDMIVTYPNSHMLKQMDTALMPGFGTYGEAIREKHMTDLYFNNLTNLLPRLTASRMVRTIETDGCVMSRAFLSNRYERIDDIDTVNCLLRAMDKHSNTEYQHLGGCVTSLHTYMKILTLDNVVTFTDANGNKKEFKTGFVFSNSEVGLGCCRLNMFVYETTTGSNFILSTEVGKVKYVHHGKSLGMFEDDIITKLQPPTVDHGKLSIIQEDLYDAIGIITDREYLEGFFETLQASRNLVMDLKHPEDVAKYMNIIGKNLGISKPEQMAVVGRMLSTGDNTLYGIFEAVAHLAKFAKTYERRIELETISGDAVNKLPKHWDAIKQMAAE